MPVFYSAHGLELELDKGINQKTVWKTAGQGKTELCHGCSTGHRIYPYSLEWNGDFENHQFFLDGF